MKITRKKRAPAPGALISQLFGVTINDLLGYPTDLRCQSCGMPLTPEHMGREQDGTLNEHYCEWCWNDGAFLRDCTMEEMVEQCLPHMPGDRFPLRVSFSLVQNYNRF